MSDKPKVECQICGKKLRRLGKHLKMVHEISVQKYKKKFPGALTDAPDILEKIGKATQAAWDDPNLRESRQKNMKLVGNDPARKEKCRQQVISARKNKTEEELEVWNRKVGDAHRGKVISDKVKEKIRKAAIEVHKSFTPKEKRRIAKKRKRSINKLLEKDPDLFKRAGQKGHIAALNSNKSRASKKELKFFEKIKHLGFQRGKKLFRERMKGTVLEDWVPDYFHFEKKIMVEYDGIRYHFCPWTPDLWPKKKTSEKDMKKKIGQDRKKTKVFREAGWVVLRFWGDNFEPESQILNIIRQVINNIESIRADSEHVIHSHDSRVDCLTNQI